MEYTSTEALMLVRLQRTMALNCFKFVSLWNTYNIVELIAAIMVIEKISFSKISFAVLMTYWFRQF